MSPAVWTNNPFPGGCVPGGIISDGLRCWRRMENAMHNKYWSSRRVINKPWLGEEKGRWSTWRLVQGMSGYFYLRTHNTLRHTNNGDPGRWDYSSTNTDAAHAQVQTKAIKHTPHFTHTTIRYMHEIKIGVQTREQPLQLCPILHNGTVTFQKHSTQTETEVNDQRLLGMKRDYALSAANQMKEQKNCIRWDK